MCVYPKNHSRDHILSQIIPRSQGQAAATVVVSIGVAWLSGPGPVREWDQRPEHRGLCLRGDVAANLEPLSPQVDGVYVSTWAVLRCTHTLVMYT